MYFLAQTWTNVIWNHNIVKLKLDKYLQVIFGYKIKSLQAYTSCNCFSKTLTLQN